MSVLRRLRPLFYGSLLALATSGCIKKILLDGQISSTRKGSVGINTLGDYEVAEKAAMAGVVQLEGMRVLAPDNTDALFMLTRSWSSIGLGFAEDAMERAEDEEGNGPTWEYHKKRAEAAYDRAIFYGLLLLEQKAEGFNDAKKNAESIQNFLAQFDDPEVDAENLFWLGNAWLGKVNVAKERPEVVAEAYIGVAMIERSVALDPNYMYGSGLVVLGSFHARTPMAELDEAKVLFERALAISEGKTLMPKVQMAARYHCNKGEKELYIKRLNEVLESGDLDPYQRLANTIAKRKASRLLNPERMRQTCGF